MRLRLLSVLACLLLGACANDATGALITAEAGGTVSSSAADIVIPAASLTEDTEVMVGPTELGDLPALENVRLIVDLLPRGTVLETAASVTVHASEVGASETERVAVYQLLDGWLPMEHSTDAETGDITLSVNRFQPIGITVTEAPTGGTIEGTISWGSGEPAGMAPVELWQNDAMVTSTTSDEAGAFSFADLEAGTYGVLVNYECMINETVELAAGGTESLQLVLCGG